MKNIKIVLIGILSLSFLFTSCEGPRGRDGLDGRDGLNDATVIFEIENVDFNSANNFSFGDIIPNDIVIDDTDLVLIYRSNEVTLNGDAWQLLPQNFFVDQGSLIYNFNHTSTDFEIILDSNFDLNTLTTEQENRFLNNQIFRIAIVSARLSSQGAKVLNTAFDYENISKNATFLNHIE